MGEGGDERQIKPQARTMEEKKEAREAARDSLFAGMTSGYISVSSITQVTKIER